MVLKESLLLGALGGLAGILIGLLMARLIGSIPAIGEMVGTGQFDLALLAQAMFVALVLAALGGLYPAWRATRMSPIEALRYE
jgi:putative ABC transport system permease protein